MQVKYEIYRQGHIELVVREEDEDGIGRNVLSVDVSYDSKFGQTPVAEVNWSALGSVSPEVAAEYASMLTRAAHLADAMNHSSWTSLFSSTTSLAVLGGSEQVVRKVEAF